MKKEQYSPKEILKEMKSLRRRLTTLEKNLVIEDDKHWANITREVDFKPNTHGGKIDHILISHRCYTVGILWLKDFPDIALNSEKHYKVEWIGKNLRILWDGKGR